MQSISKSNSKICLRSLWKWTWNMWKAFLELDKYFKKNKRNLIIIYRWSYRWSIKESKSYSIVYTWLSWQSFRDLSYLITWWFSRTLETTHNLLLSQDKYVQIRWNTLSGPTKMQHHLRIHTWCLIWNQTLRKGFKFEATF